MEYVKKLDKTVVENDYKIYNADKHKATIQETITNNKIYEYRISYIENGRGYFNYHTIYSSFDTCMAYLKQVLGTYKNSPEEFAKILQTAIPNINYINISNEENQIDFIIKMPIAEFNSAVYQEIRRILDSVMYVLDYHTITFSADMKEQLMVITIIDVEFNYEK